MKVMILVLMFGSFFNSKAQSVENSAYEVMLKAMLSHSINEIDVEIANKKASKVIFVDSRERKEFEVSHIKNAIWVGYDSLDLADVECLDKDSEIIVYCSVGYRSEKVAEKLKEKGFSNVSNLYGGIFEWKNRGLQIVDQKNQPTDSIHAYNKVWGVWLNKGVKVY